MNKLYARIQAFVVCHRTVVSFAGAMVIYGLCSLFYMGGSLTECSQSLLSFPGDNTAGLIAFFSLDNHDPWFGRTDMWSFPYGESIGQPTQITAQTLFIPFWALAKLLGPICGFNILTLIGFMSAALTMFAFVRWLLGGRTAIALLAGFAAAFTPYLQIKTGVHISYVFEAVFVTAIWLFLLLWQKPGWKWAVPLGVVVAGFAYTDGYFILLGWVLMAALVIGALLHSYFAEARKVSVILRRRLKFLAVSLAAALVCMLPVLYVMLHSSAQISESLTTTRDSIGREAAVYGARPLEYLEPNGFNPITDHIFGNYASRDNHGSNPSENVLSFSLVMIGLAVFFITRVVLARRRGRPLVIAGSRRTVGLVATIFGAVLVIAVLCSFPPKLGPIPMPSYVVISFVQLWRVFARLAIIANIALVVLGSFGLVVLVDQAKGQWRRLALVAAAFVLILLEYLTFIPPRQTHGYEQVPQMYYWLRTQQQYKTMAEYPLDEFAASGYPVFYSTYQRIHGKKLLNGVMPNKQATLARAALRDLHNPQAVPGLRMLGIDFVTVHDTTDPGTIPGLRLVYKSQEPIIQVDNKPDIVWGYAVQPGPKARYTIEPTAGFHAPVKKSPIHSEQVMGHEGVIGFSTLPLGVISAKTAVTVALQARSLARAQEISIVQGTTELWHGFISPEQTEVHFVADASQDVHIKAVHPLTDASDSTLQFPLITLVQQ